MTPWTAEAADDLNGEAERRDFICRVFEADLPVFPDVEWLLDRIETDQGSVS